MKKKIVQITFLISIFLYVRISYAESNNNDHVIPEKPLLERPTAPVSEKVNRSKNKSSDYTYPVIPPFNTTLDGRLALSMESVDLDSFMEFNLIVPEKANKPLMIADKTGSFLFGHSSNYRFKLDALKKALLKVHTPESGKIKLYNSHHSFCEEASNNPRICGENECYDLYFLLFGREEKGQRIWKIPATVSIRNPKSKHAKIDKISFKEKGIEHVLWPMKAVFEPVVTRDGKLMVTRAEGSRFTWHRSALDTNNPGKAITGKYDIFFAYSDAPCNIHEWAKNYYPITYANSHPIVKEKYGFAKFTLKDTEGNSIPDTQDLAATYPWVDREGNNIFFSLLNTSLYYKEGKKIKSRYPARCVQEKDCIDPIKKPDKIRAVEPDRGHIGFAFSGLWSSGKIVLLDTTLHHTDFALGLPGYRQRYVTLYEKSESNSRYINTDGEVRVAAGRDQRAYMPGGVDNTTIPHSIQNIFNYYQNMKPVTNRDIVWIMTKGHISDEIIFDDYIDPHVLIFSEMLASWTQENDQYNDGWVTEKVKNPGFRHSATKSVIRLQNSSTTEMFEKPKYGVVNGRARIEPVALGGIRGRGFWLDPETSISYESKKISRKHGWYVGLFIDSRSKTKGYTHVMTIPGFDEVEAGINTKTNELEIVIGSKKYGIKISDFQNNKWFHLGLHYPFNKDTLDVFINGQQTKSFSLVHNDLSLIDGSFMIGSKNQKVGFHGWVDEFKVIIDLGQYTNTRSEIFCNHAKGTIIGGNTGPYDGTLDENFESCNEICKNTVEKELVRRKKGTHKRYACYHDYSKEYWSIDSVVNKDRHELMSLRQELLFPEGPLRFNYERPDSTNNNFCLNCHVSQPERPDSLGIKALMFHPHLAMENDSRRQPSQPPALRNSSSPLVYGFPPEFLDSEKSRNKTRNTPINIDEYLFDPE